MNNQWGWFPRTPLSSLSQNKWQVTIIRKVFVDASGWPPRNTVQPEVDNSRWPQARSKIEDVAAVAVGIVLPSGLEADI